MDTVLWTLDPNLVLRGMVDFVAFCLVPAVVMYLALAALFSYESRDDEDDDVGI